MQKKESLVRRGTYVDGKWQLKNLKFLVNFMDMMGITTKDVADIVNLSRNGVTRWMMVDDTYLSHVIKVADHYGYDFIISYDVNGHKVDRYDRTYLVIDKPVFDSLDKEENRLSFITRAMAMTQTTIAKIAEKLGVCRATPFHWFKKDDITFSYIYKIAEAFDWNVNIRFKNRNLPSDSESAK